MTSDPINTLSAAERVQEFEAMLVRCQQAAKEGDLTNFRALDHQLRNMAMALIAAMPSAEPDEAHYFEALRDAVVKLGTTADEIEQDRRRLQQRKGSDRKVRLAYSRGAGRF